MYGLPLKIKNKIPGDFKGFFHEKYHDFLTKKSMCTRYSIYTQGDHGWRRGRKYGNLDPPDCLKITFPGLDRSLIQGKFTFKRFLPIFAYKHRKLINGSEV